MDNRTEYKHIMTCVGSWGLARFWKALLDTYFRRIGRSHNYERCNSVDSPQLHVATVQLNNTYKRGEALLVGWVHAHNCIRAEVDKMLFVLEHLHTGAAAGRERAAWEVTAIKDWWKAHAAHIHNPPQNRGGAWQILTD